MGHEVRRRLCSSAAAAVAASAAARGEVANVAKGGGRIDVRPIFVA